MNKKDQEKIDGGYTLWAKKTIDSEIFFSKPAEWFKIWFYIVNKVYYKKVGKWDRGSRWLSPIDIAKDTRTSIDQVKKCLAFLRKSEMIGTRRSTRGIHLEVVNFNYFQTAKNYKFSEESPDASTNEALEEHQRSTTIGKEVRSKEIRINTASQYSKEINSLISSFKKINPSAKNYYKNTTQRKACEDLIETYGFAKTKDTIDNVLEKTNKLKFLPSITTPQELFDKWIKLKDGVDKMGKEDKVSKTGNIRRV